MGNVNVNYTPVFNACSDISSICSIFTEDTTIEQIVNCMVKDELHTTLDISGNYSYPFDGSTSIDILTKKTENKDLRVVTVMNNDCDIYNKVFEYYYYPLSKFCIGKSQSYVFTYSCTSSIAENTSLYIDSEFGYCKFTNTSVIESGYTIKGTINCDSTTGVVSIFNGNTLVEDCSYELSTDEPESYTEIIPTTTNVYKYGKVTSGDTINENDLIAIFKHIYLNKRLPADVLNHASCTYKSTTITIADIVVMLRYLYPWTESIIAEHANVQNIMGTTVSKNTILVEILERAVKNLPIPAPTAVFLAQCTPYRWINTTSTLNAGTYYINLVSDAGLVDSIYRCDIPVDIIVGGKILVYICYPPRKYVDIYDGSGNRYSVDVTLVEEASGSEINANNLTSYEKAAVIANNCFRWICKDGWKSSVNKNSENILTLTQNEFEGIVCDNNMYYNVIYPCGDTLVYRGDNCINANIKYWGTLISSVDNNRTAQLAVPSKFHNTSTSTIGDTTSVGGSDTEWSGLIAVDFAYGCETVPKYFSALSTTTLLSVELPGTITNVKEYAFSSASLAHINFNPINNVTIGDGAFFGAVNLNWTEIPSAVKSIGSSSFAGCTQLTKAVLQITDTSLAQSAFANCSNITETNIPVNITSIGASAYSNCTSLTNITYAGTTTQWASVTKTSGWNTSVPATVVHCSDGDVNI